MKVKYDSHGGDIKLLGMQQDLSRTGYKKMEDINLTVCFLRPYVS